MLLLAPNWLATVTRQAITFGAQGEARLVDPVVNGQLPSPKPVSPVSPEPTGINFIELPHDQKDDEEDSVPW
jgi:hypothetical protein